MPPAAPTHFDHLAQPYRWLEYFSFGPMLERCRFHRIPELATAQRALVLGDGDGRFLARLLTANLHLQADVVDQSPAMLRLLEARASAAGARDRIRIHQADVLAFVPAGTYDLVVTHFFLDCFTTEDVETLAETIRPHLAPNARWLISEFAIPGGIASLPAKSIVASLYAAFRVLTGLRTRSLPNYAAVLTRSGFTLEERKPFLAGLLVSELWNLKENVANPPAWQAGDGV
ncbi:MAG: class I SAM-dependent methyltransferase [Silvibacterium sp.]